MRRPHKRAAGAYHGAYAFRQLGPGSYTVTASKTGCTFNKAPSKQVGSNLIIINFTGNCQ